MPGQATFDDLAPDTQREIAKLLDTKSLAQLSKTSATVKKNVEKVFDPKREQEIVSMCQKIEKASVRVAQDAIYAHKMVTQIGYTSMVGSAFGPIVDEYERMVDNLGKIKRSVKAKGSKPCIDALKKAEFALSKLSSVLEKL